MSRAAHTRNRSLTLTRTTLLAGRPSTCWQRRLITRHLFGGFMSRVLVVDAQRQPLHPCTPARARLLLKQRKAAVLRRFPFVLILQESKPETLCQELRVKIDPGSKTTGVAVVNDGTGEVLWAAELVHRGQEVREALAKRRRARRARRARHTRYRKPRFTNRRRPKGWLPPSLRSRRDNVLTWVVRLRRWCPVGALSLELVTFDTALMQDTSLQGKDYQTGTLAGCEVRQYVLLKWKHACAFCGVSGVPLELDHVVPRSRGGSDRESRALPKTHWLDAAAVGASTPAVLRVRWVVPWLITAERRQCRQMMLMDKRGFPRTRAKGRSCVQGFRTGDIVRATVPSGTKSGSYLGRVAVRASGFFNIATRTATVQSVAARYCTVLQHTDGYSYQRGARCFLPIP